MAKKKERKQKNEANNRYNYPEEKLIEIYEEAYYRAIKRIKQEEVVERNENKTNNQKQKWYIKLLLILNVIFFPWKINNRFQLKNQIYDSLLVSIVSTIMQMVGTMVWLFGIGALILINRYVGLSDKVLVFAISISALLFGSILIVSGGEFGKESDSNKIYAYSASIIALISCIIGIIALIKT